MSTLQEIKIPDIGGAEQVDIIEIFVGVGDVVKADDSLLTLESDKASMEIPVPMGGTVAELKVAVGDKVSEGDLIILLEMAEAQAEEAAPTPEAPVKVPTVESSAPEQEQASPQPSALESVFVPDIGTDAKVDVIEVFIKAGDTIAKDDSLITLESDKASMEIPAPAAGVVESLNLSVGDKVGQGDVILTLFSKPAGGAAPASVSTPTPTPTKASAVPPKQETQAKAPAAAKPLALGGDDVHAGPSVRRFARELGVDLSRVPATGRKGRILLEDVRQFVKQQLTTSSSAASSGGMGLPEAPVVDHSKFGEVETLPLNKIKRLTAQFLHRNWLLVPHVTQFEEADITKLEAFRQAEKKNAEKQGFKLTPLVFIMKAVVAALKAYPTFNASLDESGENLILKKYYNIGVAVDTPNGLVVPVVRDVDKKGIFQLAEELGKISLKAREKGLSPSDMQGSTFTLSSLGGIGGTAFTPIVNLPDVAILGISKSSIKPIYEDGEFVPKLMLPLSLSYDHRVIDGAEGARFTSHLARSLSDIRTLLL